MNQVHAAKMDNERPLYISKTGWLRGKVLASRSGGHEVKSLPGSPILYSILAVHGTLNPGFMYFIYVFLFSASSIASSDPKSKKQSSHHRKSISLTQDVLAIEKKEASRHNSSSSSIVYLEVKFKLAVRLYTLGYICTRLGMPSFFLPFIVRSTLFCASRDS